MKKIFLSLIAFVMASTSIAQTSDFFDHGLPDRLFVLGVRMGVNTSNLSDNYSTERANMIFARNQWKAGFTVGAVMDINVRNFLTLQPGVFLQTRNHDYSHIFVGDDAKYFKSYQGNRSSSYIQIPILASLRKQFTPELQVQVDFGPYFMYGIGGSDEYRCYSSNFLETGEERIESYRGEEDFFGSDGAVKGYDWGFKFGAGAVIMDHYYIGVHYEAGCRNILKKDKLTRQEYSGHNKVWNFTIGYNF